MLGTTAAAGLGGGIFWGLETAAGRPLPPRRYTHGLTQLDAVADIVRAFNDGASDVFFHANLGSGKSLIALHVIANMGRGLVVVPTKNLQDQYAEDYEGKLVIRHARSQRPVAIRVMKGRNNFHCDHHGRSAASSDLVCTKELPPSVPRWRLASQCPDWSPVYKKEIADGLAEKVFMHDEAAQDQAFQADIEQGAGYDAIFNEHVYVPRGNPCPYFAQYDYYQSADALVMNQAKWQAETALGRKPRLDVEVFDEADHFLDSLGQTVEVGLKEIDIVLRAFMQFKRLGLEAGGKLTRKDQLVQAQLQKARKALNDHETLGDVEPPIDFLETMARLYENMDGDEPARKAGAIRDVLEHPDAVFCIKEPERYLLTVGEPRVILRSFLNKSGPKRLWMSATLQDPAILREVYGFRDPVVIRGEVAYQGRMFVCTPEDGAEGHPVPIRWEKWYGTDGAHLREGFVKALTFIRKHAKGPTAYVVHGKGYVESVSEESVAARHVLKLLKKERESDEALARFMSGEDKEIASTRMNRGVDFKGDICRDLVLIKYPIPDISDPKFQAVRKKFREKYGEQVGDGVFWRYVRDCARRTLLQQVGRGMRASDDWVRVWTTDEQVLQHLTHRFPDKGVVTHVKVRQGQRKLPPE